MDLIDLKIPAKKISQLQNAGITKMEDLVYYYPKKYIDRTCYTNLLPEGESIFLFHCTSVHAHFYSKSVIEAIGVVAGKQIPVHILWFNQQFLQTEIEATKGKQVLVAGVAIFKEAEPQFKKPARYEVQSPAIYSPECSDALRIYPSYKKVPGMADEYLQNVITTARQLVGPLEETVPEEILSKQGLISHTDMVEALHEPQDATQLEAALRRRQFDDLLYFAFRMELENRRLPAGSVYNLLSLAEMNKARGSLPYALTEDQQNALSSAIAHIRTGKRLNALLQGDVGCGKTIVAMLLMIAFASNGYQAALMAPTTILAKQHYDDLYKLCSCLNIPIAYIGGGVGAKEQRELEAGLADGSIRLVVGTQALILNKKYQFKNLAFVVEDEEHKYGVVQRTTLAEKAAGGTHVLTMSATPIPRSLAQTIYGDSLQLYTITQKPAGRKPVMTGIAPDANKAISFLRRNCGERGFQAYVVCPMITESDKVEGITTAEAAFADYQNALKDKNISVALVTGNTPQLQTKQTLQSFEEGAISVLVSTTIIEVGVNVPNANCIIIHNAERFGLAQLHQLRGRVGRGNSDAFCCLISGDPQNARLQTMVQTNDGFKIAQMDLQQRGAGDLLGVQQSGTEKLLSMAVEHPKEYQQAQKAARDILDNYPDECLLLQKAQEDLENQVGGEIIPGKS